jgi:hypothetical protein
MQYYGEKSLMDNQIHTLLHIYDSFLCLDFCFDGQQMQFLHDFV